MKKLTQVMFTYMMIVFVFTDQLIFSC